MPEEDADAMGDEAGEADARETAATKIQALQRGNAGRRRSAERKAAGSGPKEAPGGADLRDAGGTPDDAAQQGAAATRIQAAARGRAARRNVGELRDALPQRGPAAEEIDDAGGLQPYLEDGALVKAYEQGCKAAGRKPSHLVRTCLHESIVSARETFFIEAPGCHKLAFTSRLADEDMVLFAQVFHGPVAFLARLDLSYNLLTDAGAETLAVGMLGARARRLASLSLRSNAIGPQGCLAVCQAIVNCPLLKRLDFSHNPLGRDGGLTIVDFLHRSQNLLELFIQDTDADIDVLVAMATALLSSAHKLKVCNVENPRIETLQEDHTVHLGRMLRVNTHLSEIYMGKLGMRDEGVRQLVSFLLENKTLRVLDLRGNEVGADGAGHLGVLLASDCQLAQLALGSNRIGEKGNVEGAKAIAHALLNNRMLRHLDLNNNSLCGPAIKVLADAIDQNSTLETIGLFHNQWDQPSSYRFHQILNDRARILPLRADFVTSEVDLRIDICKVHDFKTN